MSSPVLLEHEKKSIDLFLCDLRGTGDQLSMYSMACVINTSHLRKIT